MYTFPSRYGCTRPSVEAHYQVSFARTSSFFSPGVAASSHIAVASEAMIIAVRSFDLVDLLAETTMAPVVDTSAAAVSRVGSSAVLSRSHRWGILTDITVSQAQGSPVFVAALAPRKHRSKTTFLGPGDTKSSHRLHLTSSPTWAYCRLQRLQRLRLLHVVVWCYFRLLLRFVW